MWYYIIDLDNVFRDVQQTIIFQNIDGAFIQLYEYYKTQSVHKPRCILNIFSLDQTVNMYTSYVFYFMMFLCVFQVYFNQLYQRAK